MSEMQKIKIRIGDAEFEAEGPRDAVQAQYEMFIEAMKLPRSLQAPISGSAASTSTTTASLIGVASPDLSGGVSEPGISEELMHRTFLQEKNFVTLRAIPKGDSGIADALILLIYGFKRVRSEDTVTGVMLMKAAEKSGIRLDRIDRSFGRHAELVITAGFKRGRTYQLNNRGIATAEKILCALFQ